MGYYTEKYSTLRILLRWRSKLAARRVVRYSSHFRKEIEEADALIKNHLVTKGIKATDKIIRHYKRFFHNNFLLLKDEEFQEDRALSLVEKIEDILLHIEQNKIKDKDVQEFEKFMKGHLLQSISKGEAWDRAAYQKLMTVINQSQGKTHTQFMTNVRNALKTMKTSNLARFPFYVDIRKEQMDIRTLQKVNKILKNVEGHIKSKNFKAIKKEIKEIESIFNRSKDPIYDVFQRAYVIKHRDFVITLMALEDEAFLEAILEEDVHEHLYPELKGKQEEEKLAMLREKFRDKLQAIAQAERIFIHKEQQLLGKAKALNFLFFFFLKKKKKKKKR